MAKWEYCEVQTWIGSYRGTAEAAVMYFKRDGNHVTLDKAAHGQALAALGDEGWELVSAYGGSFNNRWSVTYTFKRALPG